MFFPVPCDVVLAGFYCSWFFSAGLIATQSADLSYLTDYYWLPWTFDIFCTVLMIAFSSLNRLIRQIWQPCDIQRVFLMLFTTILSNARINLPLCGVKASKTIFFFLSFMTDLKMEKLWNARSSVQTQKKCMMKPWLCLKSILLNFPSFYVLFLKKNTITVEFTAISPHVTSFISIVQVSRR